MLCACVYIYIYDMCVYIHIYIYIYVYIDIYIYIYKAQFARRSERRPARRAQGREPGCLRPRQGSEVLNIRGTWTAINS